MSLVATERGYWEQHLAGGGFICAGFPTLPAGPAPSAEPVTVDCTLTRATADRLLALANGADLALFTLLLAGLRQLLFRYTGETRLAIGTAPFVLDAAVSPPDNLLILADEVRPARSFKETLLRERDVVLGAKRHQDFPTAHVLAAAGLGNPSASSGVWLHLANIQAPAPASSAAAGVAFSFERRDRAITGVVRGSAPGHPAGYLVQLVAQLDTLLLAGCTQPSSRFAAADLLSPTERTRLLTTFSRHPDAAGRAAVTSTIVSEFEQRSAETPARVALACDGVTVTYAALNRRANRLARVLRAQGVAPEERVALHLGRSIEVVVGMLGILKARAAYLPLDPAHPVARKRFMIEDAGVRFVLTDRTTPPAAGSLGAVTWIPIDAGAGDDVDDAVAANLPGRPDPENIAYVLYTSGTTGKPKGVRIPHRGVVQLARRTDFARVSPDETFLLQSALTFDASTYETWAPLLNGARLAIAPGAHTTLEALAATLRSSGTTTLLQTAALFHLLVDEQRDALLPLRQILVGGDILSVRHAREFLRTFSGRLCNVYGPTENSVISTAHLVSAEELHRDDVPIGRPAGDTEVYVLDGALRPVPVGVMAEIYLGGGGLARDYLERPALTAERFLPHPFSATPGARLYRSGDLGRFLPDGSLEFGGRLDGQVKLRGFRVELGEVESLLGEHPAVKVASVVAHTDAHGAKRLIAFVVARAGQSPTGGQLHAFLQERTPAHQIPASFIFRDELPLNPSGKIDRRQLLALIPSHESRLKTAPASPEECAIAAIWQTVLGRDNFGAHDDFFDVGGDSLLAMQVLARINKSGRRLPAKAFFREPTIAACARAARPIDDAGESVALPRDPIPLTPVQQWFFEHHPVDPHHFNLSAMFDVKSPLAPALLAEACGHLIRHHDALQMSFTNGPDGWRAHYTPAPDAAWFATVDLSATPAATRSAELTRRADAFQTSLELSRSPLVRFVYFQCGDGQRDRLLVVAHHLVIDAVSWRILLDDLETALRQLQAGGRVQLPRPTDRFGGWSAQIFAYARTEQAAAGRAYWFALAGSLARAATESVPTPPAYGPRDMLGHTFSPADTTRLLAHVAASPATMEEYLLAALLLAYPAPPGASRLAVTLDRHGRAEAATQFDVSRTIGWFTAFLPVYLEFPDTPTFPAALATVVRGVRAIPNRGFDYSCLRYLGTDDERRQLAALPAPALSLNYQGEFDLELAGSDFFALSQDGTGAQRSPRHTRAHTLEIDASIVEGRLGLLCAFDVTVHPVEQTRALLASLAAVLECVPPADAATPIRDTSISTNVAVASPSDHAGPGHSTSFVTDARQRGGLV